MRRPEIADQVNIPTLRLVVSARPENVAVIRQALAGLAAELGASADLIDDLKTAVSEAATNAIVHAYPERDDGPLEVAANVIGSSLEVLVRDNGIGMQPRPVSEQDSGLRVGLALIGAVSDGLEIHGEQDKGTEVRIRFDLARAPGDNGIPPPAAELAQGEATRVEVRGAEAGGAALPKVLELLAARANLSLDRLSDSQLIGDFLAYWNSRATVDSRPLEMTVAEADGAIEVRVGPLEPGVGRAMLEQGSLPGLGNTLQRLASRIEVNAADTPAGKAEFLSLRVSD